MSTIPQLLTLSKMIYTFTDFKKVFDSEKQCFYENVSVQDYSMISLTTSSQVSFLSYC